MTRKLLIRLALLLAIPGLVFTASCSKKVTGTGPGGTADSGMTRDGQVRVSSRHAGGNVDERYRHLAAPDRFPGDNIQFEFDSSNLVSQARKNLRRTAAWLLAHPEVNVVIQGHCDERGMSAYNIALGDQRAYKVKEYLTDLGVGPNRLTTISYGEERPLDPGKGENAWSKNRRVQFE